MENAIAQRRASSRALVLDPNAVSAAAEYARYLDGDVLGKIVARNLLLNVLGYAPEQVDIPIGRYGDAATRYAREAALQATGDGSLKLPGRSISFEIKCARISIANRGTGGSVQNWAHGSMLTTPAKIPKSYDLLIAIGLEHLGLEDEQYWEHLKGVESRRRAEGIDFSLDALPHEPQFLAVCSFLLIARTEIPSNFFRVNVATAGSDRYAPYQAWGADAERCRARWNRALAALGERTSSPATAR